VNLFEEPFSPESFWTSGNDLANEGNFVWNGTSKILGPYLKWEATQPDNDLGIEHCLHYRIVGGVYSWNDWPCDDAFRFICEQNCGKLLFLCLS
jgi:hypothetical protein